MEIKCETKCCKFCENKECIKTEGIIINRHGKCKSFRKCKDMICLCGNIAKYSKNLKFNNQKIDGWKCDCGNEYYNPFTVETILLMNKNGRKQTN